MDQRTTREAADFGGSNIYFCIGTSVLAGGVGKNRRARTGTEPSLEAPVGLAPETALSESASETLTVYFQDARISGQS